VAVGEVLQEQEVGVDLEDQFSLQLPMSHSELPQHLEVREVAQEPRVVMGVHVLIPLIMLEVVEVLQEILQEVGMVVVTVQMVQMVIQLHPEPEVQGEMEEFELNILLLYPVHQLHQQVQASWLQTLQDTKSTWNPMEI